MKIYIGIDIVTTKGEVEMSWYYGTFSCGHQGRVNICGPTKNRQWIADRRFSGLCEECFAKDLKEKRQKESEKAAELAKEMELPELSGTPKQITWANTLRQRLIQKFLEDDELTDLGLSTEELNLVLTHILQTKKSARFYIENRTDIWDMIQKEKKEALKPIEVKEAEKQEEDILLEIKAEATIFPKEKVTNGVVEITFAEDCVSAKFEYNEQFIKLLKQFGFNYERREKVWKRKISEVTGSAEDRAAEVGNQLLNAGFPICILDVEVREKAVQGIFEPECKRWIYRRMGTDDFAIRWTDRSDMYRTARSLPGSKWDYPFVLVNVSHFEEVEEFAELYQFQFTQKACELIKTYKTSLESAAVVEPAAVIEEKPKDGLEEILQQGAGILDDLKDED
ncbi:hypothetical protein [Paenibacillus larvae]|uniref:Uncharacterized protein n=1 Tax=Paenibacillus larvae subsp. larvae TaxID=147375 RepID=A0A2L1U7G1_9BACL|nr:hypothetical protein [Paenibacillus larvae]AVF28866.1 hypothetical protein ERICIII_04864 [Paenibacillus larvae subsp. larvae]MCY9502427.1 hypothetical protein [Paenibacillus larvae]MDR5608761.1 hypothetical protein [Paenibacillus larvae]